MQKNKRQRVRSKESVVASLAEILTLIRLGRANTRLAIEESSEYGRAIVADRLATLTELGLVHENDAGESTRGRAPRLVQFCADRALIFVATLGSNSIGAGLVDLDGNLVTEHHETADLSERPDDIVDRILRLIDWTMSRQPAGQEIWGISIALPGPVIGLSSSPFEGQNQIVEPTLVNADVLKTLFQAHRVPIWLRSSVETMTMGEYTRGVEGDVKNMLFVKLGRQIGAGLVSNGQLYRGAIGAVGLIGHLPVAGEPVGTLDGLAGTEMVLREGQKAAEAGSSPRLREIFDRTGAITVNDVCQSAQMGDIPSIDIISKSGHRIGETIATLANMLNPELVVLSGDLAQSNDILLAAVRERLYRAAHPLATRDLHITRSQMGGSASLIGAGQIAVETLFELQTLRQWVDLGSPVLHPIFADNSDSTPAVRLAGRDEEER